MESQIGFKIIWNTESYLELHVPSRYPISPLPPSYHLTYDLPNSSWCGKVYYALYYPHYLTKTCVTLTEQVLNYNHQIYHSITYQKANTTSHKID